MIPKALLALRRPTHAQVTANDELSKLIDEANAAAALAVTVDGSELLYEVATTAIALRSLVRESEGWIGPAKAHIDVSRPMVAAIRRAGEDR